jgi:glycosyltransferase involved in cell wall biosynthesis
MKKNLHVITRCFNLDNVLKIKENVYENLEYFKINWHVIFDTSLIKDIPGDLLSKINNVNSTKLYFVNAKEGGMLYEESSDIIISNIKEGLIYFLNDHNTIRPQFLKNLSELINTNKANVYVFSQIVHENKNIKDSVIRHALPENVKVGKIDIGQYVVERKIFDNFKFIKNPTADGIFIEEVYSKHNEDFAFIKNNYCNYKSLEKEPSPKLPKILYISSKKTELKTSIIASGAAVELDVLYRKDDKAIIKDLHDFNPDAIITKGKSFRDFPILASLPLQFRRKWVNLEKDEKNEGDIAYNVASQAMLNPTNLDDQSMISFFTPIYNTGDKLWETYQSFNRQTYKNIEWVLMNDSTDGGKTLKIAEQIAKVDPRVKVYDFREKSKGNIGEVKWRACAMARGYILAELDHDDLLVEDCAEYLHKAAQKHPECGFFYNDTALVDEKWNPITWEKPFALHYGSYRTVNYKGKKLQVANQQNINPKTIRHIVGVPNHVRAWRRSTYFEIGGHNRSFTVADDYELCVRTFLKTKICKIPRLGYIQFIYEGERRNTHDLSRADIQRRVRSIQLYYDLQIKERFEELGLEDWAYAEMPEYATFAKPRFGDEEGCANIIYKEEE